MCSLLTFIQSYWYKTNCIVHLLKMRKPRIRVFGSSPRVDQKVSCRFWIQNQNRWVPKTSLLRALYRRFKSPGSPEGEVLQVMQLEGKRRCCFLRWVRTVLAWLGMKGVAQGQKKQRDC